MKKKKRSVPHEYKNNRKKGILLGYPNLAKSIYKRVLDDPIYFNTDDVLGHIYYKYEQTKDDKLVYLHQEINKKGILIRLNIR